MDIKNLAEIRKYLHRNPELSGKEKQTSEFISEKLKESGADEVITGLGGTGVAGVFKGKIGGIRVMLRAELDALPIPEINDFDYKSNIANVAHKCGHDGHMTILLGVASRLKEFLKNKEMTVITLFQPAEETAQGAKAVLEDEKFEQIRPDYIFGLHNLPGFPKGSIISKKGIFASASTGLIARFHGKTSHAGHPENGNNPVLSMTNTINGWLSIPAMSTPFNSAANVTVIHAKLGEIAFGTSAGEAVVMATFRAHSDEVMQQMCKKAEKIAAGNAGVYGLGHEIEYVEYFSSTVNDDNCACLVEESAKNKNFEIVNRNEPFPWSEDFGFFLKNIPGAFFGLGSGENHPQLHNPDYDFPDGITANGIEMFMDIIERVSEKNVPSFCN